MSESDGGKLLELTAKTERAVLSALTYDAKFRSAWMADAALFSSPATKALAVAIARCQRSGWDGDDQQVALELRRDNALQYFPGGAEGVTEILVGTPAVVDPWPELQLLRELKAIRALRHSIQNAIRTIETTCDLSEARALTSEALAQSYDGTGQHAQYAQEALANAFRLASDPKLRERGIRIGVKGIDASTGGIRRRNCWVIAAKSNWGKTAMLCNIFDRGVVAGVKVGIVYGEDPEELYAQRILARRANVPAHRFRDHELTPEDMQRSTEVINAAEGWGVLVNGIGRPVESLASDIRSLSVSEGIGLWLVDYLQCFRCTTQLENQRLRIAHIARTFREAIKASNAGGVLFSQVTEDKDGRAHVRDSEDVRNDAEVLLIGQSETEQELDAAGKRTGEIERKYLYLDKNKDGPKGFRVELDWEPQYAAFQRDDRIYRPAQDWHDDN